MSILESRRPLGINSFTPQFFFFEVGAGGFKTDLYSNMTFFFPVISQVGESSTETDLILCDTLRNITIFVHDVQIC